MSAPKLLTLSDGLALWNHGSLGERVLWIHGYTLDSRIWYPLWERLPEFQHLGVDLPDHGASHELAETDDLQTLGLRLAHLAARYGVRHVVGLSFGGMIALQLAIEAQARVRTLVLGSPALAGGPQDSDAQTCNLELARLYHERGPGPWLTDRWMACPPEIFKGAASHPGLWDVLRVIVNEHRWNELSDGRMQRLALHEQTAKRLSRIVANTLLLIGEEDMAAFKRTSEYLRRTIPGCRRTWLAATGHLALLEAPDIAAPLIGAHLHSTSA